MPVQVKKYLFTCLLVLLSRIAFAQQFIFSEPGSVDSTAARTEIIGRINDRVMVYELVEGQHMLLIYDKDMKLGSRVPMAFLANKRLLYLNFISYSTSCVAIVQAIENRTTFCRAFRFNDAGIVTDSVTVDSTRTGIFHGGEVYAVSVSDNKKYFLFNRSLLGLKPDALQMNQIVLGNDFVVRKNENYFIPFSRNRQFLTNALIDNNGNVIFLAGETNSSKKTDLVFYKSQIDAPDLLVRDLPIDKYELKDISIRINNERNIYYLVAFYRESKKDNISGLYTVMLKSDLSDFTLPQSSPFARPERTLANKHIPPAQSLNDYQVGDIVLKNDGGFAVTIALNRNIRLAAAPRRQVSDNFVSYPVSAYSSWNFYNYFANNREPSFGSPNSSVYVYNDFDQAALAPSPLSAFDFVYPRANVMTFSFGKNNRSFAINSLNSLSPSAVLACYTLAVLDDRITFIFNSSNHGKPTLDNFSLFPDGSTLRRNESVAVPDGYLFFPERAKQVGEKTVIMPCLLGKRRVFAKLVFE
jgi:hypothetical protein